MVPASSITRLQAYLRYCAQQQCQTVPVPPFTIFLRPSAEAPEGDHAVPDEPLGDDVREPLARLREAFEARARRTCIRFLAEFSSRERRSNGYMRFAFWAERSSSRKRRGYRRDPRHSDVSLEQLQGVVHTGRSSRTTRSISASPGAQDLFRAAKAHS